jgi:hypothetical protein
VNTKATTQHTPTAHMEHIDRVREFASVTRGEHPLWKGDRILNGETYGFRIGLECDEAAEIVRSLGIAEREYSLLTGLPVGSLRRLSAEIKKGIRARAALAKAGAL